ncbi:hypothetical protein C1J03_16965 [Sulfitobacter sp. SK012]|nr:hypothetical protein C1J03_16965 [Sulfitobacter sp. SK012]
MSVLSRTADLYAKRSESPQSALLVKMCMVQKLGQITRPPTSRTAQCGPSIKPQRMAVENPLRMMLRSPPVAAFALYKS